MLHDMVWGGWWAVAVLRPTKRPAGDVMRNAVRCESMRGASFWGLIWLGLKERMNDRGIVE